MKASDARELKIDDRVTIRFSNGVARVGVISRIEWPEFTVALLDGKSRRYYRTRKYKSLYHVTKEDRVPTEFLKPHELPSWLRFPVNEDYEIAADFCNDQGLENTARALRDSRCDPNQLRKIDSIVVNRDTPHMGELRGALPFLLNEFPEAHGKLSRYVERLAELQHIGTGFRVRYDAAPVVNTNAQNTELRRLTDRHDRDYMESQKQVDRLRDLLARLYDDARCLGSHGDGVVWEIGPGIMAEVKAELAKGE